MATKTMPRKQNIDRSDVELYAHPTNRNILYSHCKGYGWQRMSLTEAHDGWLYCYSPYSSYPGLDGLVPLNLAAKASERCTRWGIIAAFSGRQVAKTA